MILPTSTADQREAVIIRFQRLLRALSRGEIRRNTFEAWEMDVLLDIMSCLDSSDGADARLILSRYQATAVRQLRKKGGAPMRLSRYLARLKKRRQAVGP